MGVFGLLQHALGLLSTLRFVRCISGYEQCGWSPRCGIQAEEGSYGTTGGYPERSETKTWKVEEGKEGDMRSGTG
jgi:hypothetical protein